MTERFSHVQPVMALAAASADENLPLSVLAARAGLSPFHLHRLFVAVAGETPKQYTLRLRLARAASLLLTTDQSVLEVALSCGFQSHEAFTRAFRRQFETTPRQYRGRGFATTLGAGQAASHAAAVRRAGPCLRLFHVAVNGPRTRSDMPYDVVEKELSAQPVLVVRRRVKRSEIASAIGEALPLIFHYAQQKGLALAGHPFTRYVDIGAGLLTIEPGMRVVAGGAPTNAPDSGSDAGIVVEDTLPAGPAVTTVHAGPYESLSDAYAALQTWLEAHGRSASGPPWESYITDPAEHPDPKDWRTEVTWPVGR